MPVMTVNCRDTYDWDIYSWNGERAFCIRGGPGDIFIRDERSGNEPQPRQIELIPFQSVQTAMAWISDTLMNEFLEGE